MLQVLKDNIIIKPIFEEHKGKIILLSHRTEFKQYHGFVYGVVMAVGPKYPYELKAGDKILFRRHEGKRIYIDRELYLVLREEWVDAIINFEKGEI